MITMLHVLETLSDFGGTPRKLLYLAKYIDRNKCQLVFLPFKPSSLEKRFKSLEEEFNSYGSIISDVKTTSPLKLSWKIASEAKRLRADVICTHYTRALVAGYLASKATGIPLIHNEHSSAHYRKGMGRIFAKICLSGAEAIICNSKYTRTTIEADYPNALRKLHVVYNPVEERSALRGREEIRNELGITEKEVLIGHVGGMIPQRDQGTLVKALYKVHSEYPNTKLLFIGNGPVRASLEVLIQKLELQKKVIFSGYTNAVGEYLSAMDIYVNPTLDEGFGIAVVEGMLSKVPVILSDRGAHPELITDGENGFLYRGGDPDALAKLVKWFIEHPEKRREAGIKGYENARARFSSSLYANNYLDLVENVLRNSKSFSRSIPERGSQWS